MSSVVNDDSSCLFQTLDAIKLWEQKTGDKEVSNSALSHTIYTVHVHVCSYSLCIILASALSIQHTAGCFCPNNCVIIRLGRVFKKCH